MKSWEKRKKNSKFTGTKKKVYETLSPEKQKQNKNKNKNKQPKQNMAVTTSQIIEVFSLMSCLKKKKKRKKKRTKTKSREKKKTVYETLSQETKKHEVSRNKTYVWRYKKYETKYGGYYISINKDYWRVFINTLSCCLFSVCLHMGPKGYFLKSTDTNYALSSHVVLNMSVATYTLGRTCAQKQNHSKGVKGKGNDL